MIETISYRGWDDCLRLAHGAIELVVPRAVGPRVVRFGFVGRPNTFGEIARHMGQRGGAAWRLYGGHRLWHAPEVPARTHTLDNDPIEVAGGDGTHEPLIVRQGADHTGIAKEIALHAIAGHDAVRVRHRLTNVGQWDVRLAPWALSIMAPGCQAWMPHEPYRSHDTCKLPVRTLALWPFTNMADPRWSWGRRLIGLRHEPSIASPQKIGAMATRPWLAAQTPGGLAIVRTTPPAAGAEYPDMGVNLELFANGDILELETLGPMTTLTAGGGSATLDEVWSLHDEALPTDEDARAARLEELAGSVVVA